MMAVPAPPPPLALPADSPVGTVSPSMLSPAPMSLKLASSPEEVLNHPDLFSLNMMVQQIPVQPIPPPLDPCLIPCPPVAEHLRYARLHLLRVLPGSFHIPMANSMWSWWCRSCGELPETWNRTEKGRGRKRKSTSAAGSPRSPKRGSGVADSEQVSKPETLDELPPARRPPSPLSRRRKPTTCSRCGVPTNAIRKTIDLPPARTVRSRRLAEAAAAAGMAPPEPMMQMGPHAYPPQQAGPGPMMDAFPPPHGHIPQYIPMMRPPPTLWSTPSLAHIPTSPGDLPTYPRPPVVPPPGPSGSSIPIKIPPGGGQPPPPKKRKKKSGLAKLLAQNAQRESEQGSGSWGLG